MLDWSMTGIIFGRMHVAIGITNLLARKLQILRNQDLRRKTAKSDHLRGNECTITKHV